MLTIGQLARYTGVTAKTIRFYHGKGLLPEPQRDQSGYRRYTARDAIELVKIRTLAEGGIPLAQVRALLDGTDASLRDAVEENDRQLTNRIENLQQTQRRLRSLTNDAQQLPPGVSDYLAQLREIGLSTQWIALERDLWILAFAAHPGTAPALLEDQSEAKTAPEVQEIYRDYDQARDLDPDDPRVRALADRIVETTQLRYANTPPPAPATESPIPALIQATINSSSPAWKRLDTYIRADLGQ